MTAVEMQRMTSQVSHDTRHAEGKDFMNFGLLPLPNPDRYATSIRSTAMMSSRILLASNKLSPPAETCGNIDTVRFNISGETVGSPFLHRKEPTVIGNLADARAKEALVEINPERHSSLPLRYDELDLPDESVHLFQRT